MKLDPDSMTAKDLIHLAAARGFTVVIRPGPPPMPVLRDPGGTVPPPTEPLMEALRAFREDIIEELGT